MFYRIGLLHVEEVVRLNSLLQCAPVLYLLPDLIARSIFMARHYARL